MTKIAVPIAEIDHDLAEQALEFCLNMLFNSQAGLMQNSETTIRERFEFGYSFSRLKRNDNSRIYMPKLLKTLRRQAIDRISEQTRSPIDLAKNFNNCIVSHYREGFKLEPHVDINEQQSRSFYFGENVIGVVLLADETGRLYFQKSPDGKKPIYDPKQAATLDEQNGMVYLLNGENRYAPIYHGVSPVANRRISVTYRTVHFT